MTDLSTAREEWRRYRQYRGPGKDRAADAYIAELEAEVAVLTWMLDTALAEREVEIDTRTDSEIKADLRARAEEGGEE
jgi:hypothetical protein